jgi:hypothetical protein
MHSYKNLKTLTKDEFEKAMKICFSYTKEPYLSYGDFHFLLHTDGKIGQTLLSEKKKIYEQWDKDLHLQSNTIDYPYRKFIFESSRFKEVTNALIKDKKLKKAIVNNRPCYYLPKETELPEIFRIQHQKLIEDISTNIQIDSRKSCLIAYYGLPRLYPNYTPEAISIDTKLKKLTNKLEKNAIEFMNLMCDLTIYKLTEIINQIKDGSFKEKDKKLAFLYLEQFYNTKYKSSLQTLSKMNGMDIDLINELSSKLKTMEFRWSGDGKILEYPPKKYCLDSKLSHLLYSFKKYEEFWVSKLVIIEARPQPKQLQKSGEKLLIIKEKIKQYLDNH